MELNKIYQGDSLDLLKKIPDNSIDLVVTSPPYSTLNTYINDGTEIASGIIEGEEIICRRHGARFCLKTGAVKCAPAYEAIASFPTRVVEGWIQVQDNR